MTLVQHDDMIQAISPDAANHAFDKSILLSHQLHPIGTIPHKYFRLLIHFIHALARNMYWWSSGKIGAKIASTITTLITVSGLSLLAGLALCQSTRS